jgi:ferritin
MLSKKINDALNKQMNKEFHAAYTYLATASYFEQEEFGGFANFFRIQAQEEVQHAMKFFDYMHQVQGTPVLSAIDTPKNNFSSPLDAFENSLANETKLAKDISEMFSFATSEGHAPTQIFLQWFINEQVEEEALFTRCIKRLKLVGKDATGLLTLDKEFGERTLDTAGPAAE